MSLDVFRLKTLESYPHLLSEAVIEKTLFRSEYGAFAEQLRKMRIAADFTQEELAAKMKVSQRFISRCESRERRVDFFELLDWCQATDVKLADFIDEIQPFLRHDALSSK